MYNLIAPSMRNMKKSSSSDKNECKSSCQRYQKTSLLMITKVLLICLEREGKVDLKAKVKKVLSECIKRNRNGDPGFIPLQEAAKSRIRAVVGDVRWNRTINALLARMSSSTTSTTGRPSASAVSKKSCC